VSEYDTSRVSLISNAKGRERTGVLIVGGFGSDDRQRRSTFDGWQLGLPDVAPRSRIRLWRPGPFNFAKPAGLVACAFTIEKPRGLLERG
jgi:hypothetical protein